MTAHTLYKCPDSCEGCQFCNGGLALCTVCKGAEGSLPTECPGHALTEWAITAIYSGAIDFKDGAWRYGKNPEAMPPSPAKPIALELALPAAGRCPTCGRKP